MKRKRIIILCCVSTAVILLASLGIMLILGRENAVMVETPDSKAVTSDLVIEVPSIEPVESTYSRDTDLSVESDNAIEVDENTLQLDEPTKPVSPSPVSGEQAGPVATPITKKEPMDDSDANGSGIVIDGNQIEPYRCGTPGHHCDGPETHAYIVNLEREGCPYCHKHDCPSIYAVDKWGNACYTPSQCPEYDIHKDPTYYCQDCGKPIGDGNHGTCVQFVTACHCPSCGEWVEAWTCHTCQ